MGQNFRCDSCGASFAGDVPPMQCLTCGSPNLRRADGAIGAAANAWPAPASQMSVSSTGSYGVGLYSGFYWGGLGATILGFAIAVAAREPSLIALGVIGIGLLITAFIMGLVRLYRAWDAIQSLRHEDPSESMMPTPGQAVGFLFIPFFNLYWMFVAYPGLATRMNKYLERRGSHVRMSGGLALTSCILTCVSVIPYLGSLASLGGLVVSYLLYLNVTGALNAAVGASQQSAYSKAA